ncbi:beta-propeller domain-containing protein [Cohnella herbarum]|uniref:Copper amine oxidase-like N-terminal domain-containing protein n=1 Tax=Cohnella herbarum TaxID=2728023 RepID=A0A7Z2VK05_9BACL|nr:beta-propeller domain-containing protein [Cohnella herbarum]QJD84459.1 hypothetical protein HH215_15610 [Cohnella herbarum]
MLRKTSIILWLMCILLAIPSITGATATPQALSKKSIKVWVNGSQLILSTPVYAEKKTLLVPLLEVANALKAKTTWQTDSANRRNILLSRGDRSATFTIGSALLTANGRSVKLEAAPRLVGNVALVPLRALSEALGTVVAWDGIRQVVRIDDPAVLPVIGSKAKLDDLIQSMSTTNGLFRREALQVLGGESTLTSGPLQPVVNSELPASESANYSQTNVQVNGVDEADWAKTDGRFIYQISGTRLFVSDISDPNSPKLAATLNFGSKTDFYPREMYVDGKRLIVIGQKESLLSPRIDSGDNKSLSNTVSPSAEGLTILPPGTVRSSVQTKIYELNDAGQPKLVRETTLEGSYLSSRKIDGALYVIANKSNYFVYPMNNSDSDEYEPLYGDTGVSDKLRRLTLDRIRYFPDSPDSNTLLIGALDLDRSAEEMQVSAYLGSSQTLYASTKHLYVAIDKYIQDGSTYRQETQIHKFRLDQGSIVYVGSGEVPGSILNQYAMDEHDGYFRIATTKGNSWTRGTEEPSTNNLYVLDEQMKTIGSLENLAPGERIYSTRFMGGRAYMVTFRNVDPLFAIDLRNPTKPTVLGQLKIPGYSDYLHPYDDNHIIGFGKDTVELPAKGTGKDQTTAYYQGMKVALFDVSDVTQPKEKFKMIIGDRGTGSELLSNPKALLFSKSKGLLAFPVELMEIKDKSNLEQQGNVPAYGQFAYQGAYVYNIDPIKGFTLRGRVTHLSQDDLLKSGQYGYDYGKTVRRILYSGDTLYTLSERILKANDLVTLADKGVLDYPSAP